MLQRGELRQRRQRADRDRSRPMALFIRTIGIARARTKISGE